MNENYQTRLQRTRDALSNAGAVLLGGGAGLSASDGLLYGGERFTSNFPDFIKRYGLTDMYSSGFYPFETQEEKWAYWSRHIKLNRFDPAPGALYQDLLALVQGKDHFVMTTNADGLFSKTGFAPEKLFVVQGDYGKFQCAKPCHDTLYDNEAQVREMVAAQSDCRIPSTLVPKCPRCGGEMEPNLRKDGTFVEDDHWRVSADRYGQFLETTSKTPLVLLELGVGYNTPSIIKFPFERITAQHPDATLVRMNRDYPRAEEVNAAKTILFHEDITEVVSQLSVDGPG